MEIINTPNLMNNCLCEEGHEQKQRERFAYYIAFIHQSTINLAGSV
jgi:hypothetical protein